MKQEIMMMLYLLTIFALSVHFHINDLYTAYRTDSLGICTSLTKFRAVCKLLFTFVALASIWIEFLG